MIKSIRNFLAMLTMLVSVTANATTDIYGTLLAGTFQPAVPFASLTYTNVGDVWSFSLSAFDLNSIFTSGAFIGALAVDQGSYAGLAPVISNVVGDAPVSFSPGGGPTGIFDFRFDLTDGQNRLTALETVSWDATFSAPITLTSSSFAMQVQGLTAAQGGSAWYTPQVPEPGTYALMLVGLGLLGFTAKRRNLI